MSRPLLSRRTARAVTALLATLALGLPACTKPPPPPPPAAAQVEASWQLVATALPSALLSVDGRSAKDVYAVGSDKGDGPLVVHFDGTAWTQLDTRQRGDLWWVHAFDDETVLMSGANATVLRFDRGRFERIPTPGLARHTVYGVWGRSSRDFYAVGSAAGRDGFVWHFHDGAFEDERLPMDLPRLPHDEVPGFFKVWGDDTDVWVVGAAGAVLHRRGKGAFAVVPSGTTETLFTVHGNADRVVAVGGGSNGVALESKGGAGLQAVSPPGAPLIQGIHTGVVDGRPVDWASGERGLIYTRQEGGAFQSIEHELPLAVPLSLHAIYVDPSQGVWSVGGNVLTPALDAGVLVHFGPPVPELKLARPRSPGGAPAVDGAAATTCPAPVLAAGKGKSVARRWDEQLLAAIRLDIPRPTVHARNLFHASAAMWDAWAAYDKVAAGVFVRERHTDADLDAVRRRAMSYAAYRVLLRRYEHAVGGAVTTACLRGVMADLGYDPADTHASGDDPVALGNRIGARVLAETVDDGSDEATGYVDPHPYVSPNPPLAYDTPGATLKDPDVWQQLNLSVAATQNGIILPSGVQEYIGSQWGAVRPFAMTRASSAVPWHDPGPTPRVGPAMKAWLLDVLQKSSEGDPSDGRTIDISPGAYGHNTLGTNDGTGWKKNPVTGQSYAPQVVPRADFARVMAEFWADGPSSETPPGHWNVLANQLSDSPGFSRRLLGKGEPVDALSWDVHTYLALNGAVHDAAIAAWDVKRRRVSSRPISLIRWMGGKGQSSDPSGPSYDPGGLPLVPGLVEVVTKESSAPGQRHAHLAFHVGQVAVRGWPGEPGDRATEDAGVRWVRAIDWVPYQRRTFVTPAFPAFISGHSTFSHAGAVALEQMTGSPYFPGGFGEHVAPARMFLTFERGPTVEVRLQWASFADAADEAGQSRIWGGIHIQPDDFVGRKVGHQVGLDAMALARRYFDGTAGDAR